MKRLSSWLRQIKRTGVKIMNTKNTSQNNDIPSNYWSALKNEDYGNSLLAVETWLNKADIQLKNHKSERKLTSMKTYFLANKLKFAYTFIILIVLVAACNMPVSTNESMGNFLSWTIDKNNTTAANEISKLSWIDKSQLSISENTNNDKTETIYSLVLPNSSQTQLNNYQKDLEKISGVTSVKIYPLQQNVKRPLYSAALNTFFRINVDGTNLSDKELEEQVQKQFKEAGMENPPQINFSTDANGRRQIRMKLDGQNNPGSMEVKVKDGNNEEVLKTIKRNDSADDFKGMTDDQIRNKVRKDLDNPDLKDSEIKITHDNGKLQIKV